MFAHLHNLSITYIPWCHLLAHSWQASGRLFYIDTWRFGSYMAGRAGKFPLPSQPLLAAASLCRFTGCSFLGLGC